MLRSLSNHPGNKLLALVGFTILAFSFGAYSDTKPMQAASHFYVKDISSMSNEDLLDSAAAASDSNLLDTYTASQELMNARWLEDGMADAPDFSVIQRSADYGLHFSGNIVKLRVNYDF